MIALRYDYISKDGKSNVYNLRVYLHEDQSCDLFPIIIEDPVNRVKFVNEFEKLAEDANVAMKNIDKIKRILAVP